MLRLKIQLLKPEKAQTYSHQDLIHDALVNAWAAAGATTEDIIGDGSKPWTFAALGWHRGHTGFVHTIIVSTPDPDLSRLLTRFKPETIQKRRFDEELLDFSKANISIEPDPVFPEQTQLACLFYSPLVLKDKQRSDKKKVWHSNLADCDLNDRINHRLSKLSGREVKLSILPDSLYLRANPKHSVLVNLKRFQNGNKSFVVGMQAPVILAGSEEDLRLAWYTGLGEKTRNGFGCLGLLETGVGR